MIRSRLSSLLPLAALGLGLFATAPAALAEHPLERLHRHLIGKLGGDHDRDRDCKEKDKKKKHKDDDHDRRDRSREYDDSRRGGYVSAPVYVQPTYRPQPSYYEAPREHCESFRAQPAPRSYSEELPLEAEVQVALQREGYYRGYIDGELGGQTRAAIREYQYDRGLYPSGRIDRELLRALQL